MCNYLFFIQKYFFKKPLNYMIKFVIILTDIVKYLTHIVSNGTYQSDKKC